LGLPLTNKANRSLTAVSRKPPKH